MIDIDAYRARIGTFCMPFKVKRRLRTLCVGKSTVSRILRLAVFLSVLVILGGDVELNPGPRGMRQRTLAFGDDSNDLVVDSASASASQQGRSRTGKTATKDSEVMSFLRDMKAEMKTDLNEINNKISNMNESLDILREENDILKRENREMREELSVLNSKIDKLEGHSRRNNLRFQGIEGRVNENWDETERVLRNFLSENLGIERSDSVQIERAHRVGSRHSDRCTIIAKFSHYKDKEDILRRARGTLSRNSGYMVREDYTDRVLQHRRELGKKLVEARQNGQFATLRYDKLIVDGSVYKYCDKNDQIILIGAARGRPRPYIPRLSGSDVNNHVQQRENRLDDHVNSHQGPNASRDLADESVFETDEERDTIGQTM